MTQAEKIAALEAEVARLREEIEALRSERAVHHHYHYAPNPAPVSPPPWSPMVPYSLPHPNVCGSGDQGSTGWPGPVTVWN